MIVSVLYIEMKREKNLRKINDFNFFPVCVQEICDLLELCGKKNNSNNFHLLNESEDKIDDWKWFDNRIIQNALINSTQIKIMPWGNINNDTQKYSSIEHRMKYSLIDSQPITNDCFFFVLKTFLWFFARKENKNQTLELKNEQISIRFIFMACWKSMRAPLTHRSFMHGVHVFSIVWFIFFHVEMKFYHWIFRVDILSYRNRWYICAC